MPEPELSRLEGILGREALYYQLHNKIAGAESLEELKEIEFDIMENQSPYFSAVSGRVWEDFNRKMMSCLVFHMKCRKLPDRMSRSQNRTL